MTLELVISLIAFVFITIGCIFYIIAMLFERHYDRKLWELDNKLKQDEKWRKEYRK
jgi:hypothetical protein